MKLWVLWKIPTEVIPAGVAVLSFLPPAEEEQQAACCSVLRGRELAQQVKSEAIQVYREIVARIGSATIVPGRTLRQTMGTLGKASPWWFHRVSFRDSESAEQFDWIVQILVIRDAARANGVDELVLVGASVEVFSVLRENFVVENRNRGGSPLESWSPIVYFITSRLWYLLKFVRYRLALARYYRLPTCTFDLVFSAFWDWSFKWDSISLRYSDRYFRRVPEFLELGGLTRIGYFAAFEPSFQPEQKGRRLSEVLAPLRNRKEVVILQALLGIRDVVEALLDLRPAKAMRRALHSVEFRKEFLLHELNWFSLFAPDLAYGCLNGQIPHCQLIALATQRAAERYRPRLSLSFLEHFPYARAHYEGIRRSRCNAKSWAMQHAGCCQEKTFYYLDPDTEFAGIADGCRVPTPHKVFVMGSLGREVFLKCGYDNSQVLVTGSARYDHIKYNPVAGDRARGDNAASLRSASLRVLLVCSLEVNTEILMVEAACLAAKPVPGVVLRIRNHPCSRVDLHPRFKKYRAQVEISGGSLDEDMGWSDLLIYSYSTVAEESFIQGKPVWQWLPLGFNGSALAEAVSIPQFGSVEKLRDALTTFAKSPCRHGPGPLARAKVSERLFYPADGCAAERIAAACIEELNKTQV